MSFSCLIDGTVLQQYTELIAADPGEGIALSDDRVDKCDQLAQQLVACEMAAGIITSIVLRTALC